MTVVGSSVVNSRDKVSSQRLFAEFFGNLVEFRQPSPGSAGTVNLGGIVNLPEDRLFRRFGRASPQFLRPRAPCLWVSTRKRV